MIQPNVELAADHEHYASKYFESIPAAYSAAVNTGVDLVIIPEAGGTMSRVDGATGVEFTSCIATNGHVHDQVVTALNG